MLVLFDVDGTLISRSMLHPTKDFDAWEVLPGRVERLAVLQLEGHKIGLVTNQAAVAFGIVSEEQVRAKITAVITALGLPSDTPVFVCFAHPRSPDARYSDPAQVQRRKPGHAMLDEAIAAFPQDAADGVRYVGDSEEDEQAAAGAGVPFVPAHEFFRDVGLVNSSRSGLISSVLAAAPLPMLRTLKRRARS